MGTRTFKTGDFIALISVDDKESVRIDGTAMSDLNFPGSAIFKFSPLHSTQVETLNSNDWDIEVLFSADVARAAGPSLVDIDKEIDRRLSDISQMQASIADAHKDVQGLRWLKDRKSK